MEKKTLFELFTENFQERNNRSQDKQTLLNKEIEAHEKLFDEKKLSLPLEIYSNRRPISGLHYTDGDILHIRDAYKKFIVNGADINEAGVFIKAPKVVIDEKGVEHKFIIDKRQPPTDLQMHYYNEAKMRFDYLQFLRNYKPEVRFKTEKRTLADIALQYAWENKIIDAQNKDAVAKSLGFKNGKKLIQQFNFWRYSTDRIHDQGNDRKNKNHLKIMETALKFLSKKEQTEAAENEILKFKADAKNVSDQIL